MKPTHLTSLIILAITSFVAKAQELTWPPKLPDGKKIVTLETKDFIKPTGPLQSDVGIADTAPIIDFLYYDCQTYPGKPWSVWGEGLAVGDKYYSAVGDHLAPQGNAYLYEFDTKTKTSRQLVDLRKALNLPAGHYTPGKIHSRIDMGSDGWLYFSTHRGSTRTTIPANHFTGGWILRHHPKLNKTEIVAHAPLPNQCLPTSVLDPDRLIFYAGTADGDYKVKGVKFLAYDIKNRKVLYHDDAGPYRYAIFARSTGRLYFHQNRSRGVVKNLVRFDPAKPGRPQEVNAKVGIRAATQETSKGKVYTVDGDALWEFDTKIETAKLLGRTTVGVQNYITSIDIDPKTERYLYYMPGAHGGSERDGTPIVQYDLKHRTRKVIAFLYPVLNKKFGYIPIGTFGSAVSPEGDKLYITWNGARGHTNPNRKAPFNTVAMTVIHIPASERKP
jgi:hypothetical protein